MAAGKVALVVIGAMALVFGLVAWFVLGYMSSLKTDEPGRTAIAAAASDPRVIETLGEPVTTGAIVTGKVQPYESGHARLTMTMSGPKADGRLYLEATQHAGAWAMEQIRVVTGGRCIDVVPAERNATPQ
jgi:hypothetical protein